MRALRQGGVGKVRSGSYMKRNPANGIQAMPPRPNSQEPIAARRRETLLRLAASYVWWLSPEEALERPYLVECSVMNYGTFEDIKLLADLLSDNEIRACIDLGPPGVLRPRARALFNLVVGRHGNGASWKQDRFRKAGTDWRRPCQK